MLRLKGGDPLVFGRGGEECDELRAAGVAVDVTPGITAAAGIAADLGVPLTQRGVATSVRFLTGHAREGGEDPAEALRCAAAAGADAHTTLVVYMGLATLPALSAALLSAGLDARTPALAVENGTTAGQRRVFARLAGLAGATRDAALVSPTLVLIGRVVALSPLWPWRDGADAGADTDWRLQTGPASDDASDALTGDVPRVVTLPSGHSLALPRRRG